MGSSWSLICEYAAVMLLAWSEEGRKKCNFTKCYYDSCTCFQLKNVGENIDSTPLTNLVAMGWLPSSII